MLVSKLMLQPRLKVLWAKSHINYLVRDCEEMPRTLYDLVILGGRSKAPLREPDIFDLRYIPKEPVAEYYALLIGDIVHNLRSSLDYWTTATIKTYGVTTSKNRFAMPFGEDLDNLKTQPAYKAIEKSLPVLCQFISEKIQPFPGGHGGILSAVSRLNNIDKHAFILPAVAVTRISNVSIKSGGVSLIDAEIGGDATEEIRILKTDSPMTIQSEFKTTVEVSFPEEGLFEGEPVIPTLINCVDATMEALDSCEAFLISQF